MAREPREIEPREKDSPGLGYSELGSTEQQRDERKVGLAFVVGCCCSSLFSQSLRCSLSLSCCSGIMARASLLVLGLVALLCLSTTVDAWGSDGHKIVAQIAQTFLTSAAQAAVQKQLVCRRYRHRRH